MTHTKNPHLILAKALIYALMVITIGCTARIPDNASEVGHMPSIQPDYSSLTIPINIAPLNFAIDEKGDAYITRFWTRTGQDITVSGRVLDIDPDEWHRLLRQAGDSVWADVYVRRDGIWHKYTPISYAVAEEIDPYISYRHIEPLYVNYENLRICQRHLEDFDTRDIYNNSGYIDTEGDRQCINCHSYQDYNRTGRMQMHVRVVKPGTVIVDGDRTYKVNMKVDSIWSAGAYLSLHPTLSLIAYSVNDTWQHFHSSDINKVEVQDGASDLILYDIDRNEVKYIAKSHDKLETFPYWSPDGKSLYYIAASVPDMDATEMANYRREHYRDIKYNIYKRDFDATTRTFAEPDTVFDASAIGKSATFPRVSPDGRYMIFTMGEYGTFHNFHHDADLYIMDMATDKLRPLDEVNSNDAESYHSWSSNGRWLIFSSRRGSGTYTRLYLTHIDSTGRATKPFILPQRSPSSDELLFKSYNVPEFMCEPVHITRQALTDAVEQDAINAKYIQ